MPTAYLYPGVYVEEKPGLSYITAIGSAVCAFLGQPPEPNAPPIRAVNNPSEYQKYFAPGTYPNIGANNPNHLSNAVNAFFNNGGTRCYIVNVKDSEALDNGLKLLAPNDEIASIAAPGRFATVDHESLTAFAEKQRIMAVLDPPLGLKDIEPLKTVELVPTPAKTKAKDAAGGAGAGDTPPQGLHPRISPSGFSAFYFPWYWAVDSINPDPANPVPYPPCGAMLGIWAAMDATIGVHKAPAGNVVVKGAVNLDYWVTNEEQGMLNPLGVNCLRIFSDTGIVIWGARTTAKPESEWRYINVRRLCNMIEKSILRQTSFAVFEPNDMRLWKKIKFVITAFLTNVWRDGALRGDTAEEAFFVKCDRETNPDEVVDAGQVVTWIGVAPVKPAEFVIFRITQMQPGAKAEQM